MFGDGADAVGEFAANAMYFAIGVLAYHLAQRLKRQVLPEPYCTATVATLRWKLYRLVAKLVRHARDGAADQSGPGEVATVGMGATRVCPAGALVKNFVSERFILRSRIVTERWR